MNFSRYFRYLVSFIPGQYRYFSIPDMCSNSVDIFLSKKMCIPLTITFTRRNTYTYTFIKKNHFYNLPPENLKSSRQH